MTTTSSVNNAFVPIYAFQAKDKPSDGFTQEWLQTDYSNRVKENKKPKWIQERSFIQIAGAVLGLGGIFAWIASYVKESKIGKWISGIITASGIGAIITGFVKAVDFKVAKGELSDEVEELIKQLSDTDKLESAKKRLIEIGKPATELLIEALKDTNNLVRKEAAYLLGIVGGRKVINPLIESLKDSEVSVKLIAAEALGKFGEAALSAQPELRRIIKENPNSVLAATCQISLRLISSSGGGGAAAG